MGHLNPDKLHVRIRPGAFPASLDTPRRYTLTHSDLTGDLYLAIGAEYDHKAISGLYTCIMRDEVLAEWMDGGDDPVLVVHCHVSGGLALGAAGWRESIFRQHMPMVLEAFRFGDRKLFEAQPNLDDAIIKINFHRANKKQTTTENWGTFKDYRPNT